ncbi:MAG TPA: GTP 3',8-cyclase MoaA [Acidiferrobacterales bacterium]
MDSPTLIDPFQRRIDYIRLSVTDRCDLRCSYCIPKGFKDFEEPENWLSFDEIERVVRAFTELGVRRVRVTGGEPLSRGRINELIGRLGRLPRLDDLSLSTNATRLAKHATALKHAGVSRINVSLDSLDPARFAEITGGGRLENVLDGLMAARAAGFAPIKINMVVMKDVNEAEIGDMVAFCVEHGFTLRFIETMPMGDTGRAAGDRYVDLQAVRRKLAERFELIPAVMTGGGPARYVQVQGTDLKIGFITPISQHFCATCNRVRIGVDGTLYTCLGQEHNTALRPLLRAGVSDEELKAAIRAAIARKPERHEFTTRPEKIIRFMSTTGG